MAFDPAAEYLYTTQTPSSANIFENQNVTLSTTFYVTTAGTILGGRFYGSSTVGGTYELALWKITTSDASGTGTGTLMEYSPGVPATKTFTPTASTWNNVEFTTPVAVVPGTAYRMSVRTSQGRYPVIGGGFNSAGISNGHIVAPQTGTNPAAINIGNLYNGAYIESLSAYPNKTFNGNNYMIDIVFLVASTSGLYIRVGGSTVKAVNHGGVRYGGSLITF